MSPTPNKPQKQAPSKKAACERAGWKFLPLAHLGKGPGGERVRYSTPRGFLAVPPPASGLEPRHFGGAGRAVSWAVEMMGKVATSPDAVPAGMDGIRLMLDAALTSGRFSDAEDETPEPLDGPLLAVAAEIIAATKTVADVRDIRGRWDASESAALRECLATLKDSVRVVTTLHAGSHGGLMAKARAAAAIFACKGGNVTGTDRLDLAQTLIEDLIHLLPTLTHQRTSAPSNGEPV